jgi:hypothetical protein
MTFCATATPNSGVRAPTRGGWPCTVRAAGPRWETNPAKTSASGVMVRCRGMVTFLFKPDRMVSSMMVHFPDTIFGTSRRNATGYRATSRRSRQCWPGCSPRAMVVRRTQSSRREQVEACDLQVPPGNPHDFRPMARIGISMSDRARRSCTFTYREAAVSGMTNALGRPGLHKSLTTLACQWRWW